MDELKTLRLLRDNLKKEDLKLHERDCEDSVRGEVFHWELRGNILNDLARTITGTLEDLMKDK